MLVYSVKSIFTVIAKVNSRLLSKASCIPEDLNVESFAEGTNNLVYSQPVQTRIKNISRSI